MHGESQSELGLEEGDPPNGLRHQAWGEHLLGYIHDINTSISLEERSLFLFAHVWHE